MSWVVNKTLHIQLMWDQAFTIVNLPRSSSLQTSRLVVCHNGDSRCLGKYLLSAMCFADPGDRSKPVPSNRSCGWIMNISTPSNDVMVGQDEVTMVSSVEGYISGANSFKCSRAWFAK